MLGQRLNQIDPPQRSAWACGARRTLISCGQWTIGLVAMLMVSAAGAQPPATPTAPPVSPVRGAATDEDINAQFLDPNMDPKDWAARFEVESREVFAARKNILSASGVDRGDTVADVGAGTGLFTAIFARAVGTAGWVYAVDIAPRFVEYLAEELPAAGITNVTPVLCTASSTNLPPASIDVAFVCDTYHHFDHPAATLASLRRALRPGGRLVIVDFEREEGKSSAWVLGHVRAGKSVVTSEIEAAGFKLEAEPDVEGLDENYLLVFRKPLD
jgi:predicted methyltransferase